MSSRNRLILWIVIMSVAVTLVVGAIIFFSNSSDIISKPQDRLTSIVSRNVRLISLGYDNEDDFITRENGVYCALYSGTGSRLIGRFPDRFITRLDFSSKDIRTVTNNGSTFYVYDFFVINGDETFWVRGAINTNDHSGLFSYLRTLFLIVLPSVIIIAVIGSWIIAWATLRPVEHMTDSAVEIISGQNLSRRVGLKGASDLQHLGSAFNTVISKLEQSNIAEKQFTANVSHELRTPITVILAECSHARKRCKTPEDFLESIDVIEKQGTNMSNMVQSLLALTRIESSSNAYPFTRGNLSLLVESCCFEFEGIVEKNITISTDIAEDICTDYNELLISHVVLNLLENACKYGHENGTIHVSLYKENSSAVIEVADNGIGIEKENLSRIWDRFWQADSSHGSGAGSGLGLSLVKKVTEYHKGSVLVESTFGEGSTFFIKLPIVNK